MRVKPAGVFIHAFAITTNTAESAPLTATMIPDATCTLRLTRLHPYRYTPRKIASVKKAKPSSEKGIPITEPAQRFNDRARVHAHRARHVVGENEPVRQRLDVAVEDEAHDFRVAVDHRAPGVSADDVVGRDEIEWRREVEPVAALRPSRGKL